MNEKVSIIVPARNEQFLNNTLKDLLKKATGDIEIIVILDGPPWEEPIKDPKIRFIENEKPVGMRPAINMAAKEAKGKYLMKCDAHCCFGPGFDEILKKDCKPDWTLVPRRHGIDKRAWDKRDTHVYEFQYISSPDDPTFIFKGVDWPAYANRVRGKKICPLMTSQGSCWFMYRDRFFELGGLDDKNYGTMGAEAQEVCLKSWLSGGSYMLTRNTWYAHKKKVQTVKKRGYRKPVGQWRASRKYLQECWLNDKWPGQKRKLSWLLEKFRPVPSWHYHPDALKSKRFVMARWKLNTGSYSEVNKLPREIPDLDRHGLVELWKDLGYRVGCEVGVEGGRFSRIMCEGIPGLKLYLVDQYEDYPGCRKRRGKRHSDSEKRARENTKGYNVEFIKEKTETAFNKIPDESLDFVYIDGNHKYDYVMLDLILWSRKVRPGGMVSGHDYYSAPDHSCTVKEAVDDFTKFHMIEPWYITDKTVYPRKTRYQSNKRASYFWIKGCQFYSDYDKEYRTGDHPKKGK